jgi:hypothetical protein
MIGPGGLLLVVVVVAVVVVSHLILQSHQFYFDGWGLGPKETEKKDRVSN